MFLGCNVEIRQSAGEIYSPGFYTKKYPTSISCSWTLYAPDTDKRPILLKLVKFALAADKKDVVKVQYCIPYTISFQPVLHDWCNKGCGICYPVCGMVHIKELLLLIRKSSPCGSSRFPLLLSEQSFPKYRTPNNCK